MTVVWMDDELAAKKVFAPVVVMVVGKGDSAAYW